MASMYSRTASNKRQALARELDATALQVFWSGTAFLLCSAISQPIFVHLSKFFGRKALVVSALTIYLIGTTVGMTASHINAVIAGRAFQGAGGGGVIVMTEVIITDLIPLRQRGLWLGIINGAFALGSSTGPILGGAIVEKLNWRWLFYIDLPFLALALATVSIFLQGRLDSQNRTLLIKLRSIDWIGITIFLPSVAFFITPLTYGGIPFPWVSWQTLGSIALGIIGLLAFAMYEDIRAQNRLADLHIFKQRTVLLTYIANAILYTVFGSQLVSPTISKAKYS
jgi:MFS family permease